MREQNWGASLHQPWPSLPATPMGGFHKLSVLSIFPITIAPIGVSGSISVVPETSSSMSLLKGLTTPLLCFLLQLQTSETYYSTFPPRCRKTSLRQFYHPSNGQRRPFLEKKVPD